VAQAHRSTLRVLTEGAVVVTGHCHSVLAFVDPSFNFGLGKRLSACSRDRGSPNGLLEGRMLRRSWRGGNCNRTASRGRGVAAIAGVLSNWLDTRVNPDRRRRATERAGRQLLDLDAGRVDAGSRSRKVRDPRGRPKKH